VAQKLIEKNLKLSVAESCTGGLICAKLISYPGISKVFIEGIVCYNNTSKQQRLSVSSEILDIHGAVSAETVSILARNSAISSNADIGLAVSGIAGPTGATIDKPVGLVWFAVYNKKTDVLQTERKIFNGERDRVRNRAANYALFMLLKFIEKQT